MRHAPPVELSAADRRQLEAWADAAGARSRLAQRARIVLAAADGATNARIAARLGVNLETVTRWRSRFAVNGLEGISREAPRAGGAGRVSRATVRRIVRASVGRRSPAGRPWSTRSLARNLKVNHMLVHRVWAAHGLAARAAETDRPHAPLRVDLGGAFVTPGARALVFTVEDPPSAAGSLPRLPELDPNPTGTDAFSGPTGFSREVVRTVGALESAMPARTAEGDAALLVFLRGIERRGDRSHRLEIVFDRPLSRLGRAVRRWLSAHARFRVFTPAREQRWSEAVDAWLRRWERRGMTRDSLAFTPEFGRQFAVATPAGPRKPAMRFSWGPSTLGPAEGGLPSPGTLPGSRRFGGAAAVDPDGPAPGAQAKA